MSLNLKKPPQLKKMQPDKIFLSELMHGERKLQVAINTKDLPKIKLLLVCFSGNLNIYRCSKSWKLWESPIRYEILQEWALRKDLDFVKRQFLSEINGNLLTLGLPNPKNLTQEDLNKYSIEQLENSNCSDRDVIIILNKYAVFNQRDDDNQTMLYLAIKNKHIEVIKFLLEMDADVSATATYNHSNYGGLTALDIAVELELENIVQLLLDHKNCDVNFAAESGLTPLHIAALKNNPAIAKKLISKGATIDVYSTCKFTYCSKFGTEFKIDTDVKHLNGVTAFQVAVKANSLEMVQLLLDYGADVNARCKDRGDGYTALHYAVMTNNSAMIDFLLSKGARVDAKSNNEETILHLAVGTGNKDIIKRLLDAGADMDIRSNTKKYYGLTLLLEAVRLNLKEIVLMLIDMGFDINATAKRKLTSTCVNVIDMTLEELDPDMLELVLNMGADVSNAEFRIYSFRNRKIFIKYIEEFRAAGLFVNERLTKWADSKKTIKYEDLRNERQAQVRKTEEEEIGDRYVRFYDLLFTNFDQMMMYAENESIWKALELDTARLPLATEILINNFKKQYMYYQMTKKAEKMLENITDLPYSCVRKILMYFSYDDVFECLGRPSRFKLTGEIAFVPSIKGLSSWAISTRELSRSWLPD